MLSLRVVALCSSWVRQGLVPPSVRMSTSFLGPRQVQIEQQLTATFQPKFLEVINESHGRKEDESHFKVVIVSDAFEGKRLVARHRAVNDALLEDGILPFHSLSVAAAKTPAEWEVNDDVPASPRCAGGDGKGMLQ